MTLRSDSENFALIRVIGVGGGGTAGQCPGPFGERDVDALPRRTRHRVDGSGRRRGQDFGSADSSTARISSP